MVWLPVNALLVHCIWPTFTQFLLLRSQYTADLDAEHTQREGSRLFCVKVTALVLQYHSEAVVNIIRSLEILCESLFFMGVILKISVY